MSKSVIIIGGGIIGIMSAYYLRKAGHQVTIVDKTAMRSGCSYMNAGLITPSHFIPFAAPGMIKKGLKYLLSPSGPFYLSPRVNCNFVRWLRIYNSKCVKSHVDYAISHLKNISMLSKQLFEELAAKFDFGYDQKGLLMMYITKDVEISEKSVAKMAKKVGIECHEVSIDEIRSMQGGVEVIAKGGVYFPGDAHILPDKLMKVLKKFLEKNGVQFLVDNSVQDFDVRGGKIENLKGLEQKKDFDEVILCTGSWSTQLLQKVGIKVPVEPGKGYSFENEPAKIHFKIPSVLIESRVALTPMGSSLRIGGAMEIAGINEQIRNKRVHGMRNSLEHYYPELEVQFPVQSDIKSGLRPCSPDGLPYIGRSKKIKNLIIATGHTMQGISQGPASGKLVSEIVSEKETSIDVEAFDPERYDQ